MTIRNLINPLISGLVREKAGRTYLQFNGTDQYAEHAAWTPTGVNFSISLRYTPASADIGSLVTILGDGILQKDASNNLVFNYTDTAAASQATTLTALALVADTEYLIVVSSDGNGVSITVGSDTASNAAVIDPAALEIESWMGETNKSAGVIRDISFTDTDDSSNSRNYPVASDSNIQPDTLNADGPELFVPTSLDAGWTDNGDGSYSWDASSGQFIFTASGVLSSDKYYLATFEITEYTGSGSISFSGNSLVGATSMSSVGVYTEILKGGTSTFIEFFFGFGSGTGTMENVSVKETTSAKIANFDQSMVQSS